MIDKYNTVVKSVISSLLVVIGSGVLSSMSLYAQVPDTKPNIVVIFCDDLGYGDLGAFGHPTIMTPNLDRMSAEGQRWTNFYVAAPVCTPSRAGLLTGRLPVRSGMASEKNRVLFPDSKGGLPQSEITLARQLKKAGYATACVGKWHLGHLPDYTPNAHGFDEYFGIPYSNDMDFVTNVDRKEAFANSKIEYFNVPLKRNTTTIEQPADQHTITRRYTEEVVKFIKAKRDKPFFLYLAHSMPHVPLFRSKEFENKSLRGLYGDVIEELDWSVGQVLQTLRETGMSKNTLVVFTSDNGPWLTFGTQGGSGGILKGGKGGTFEGGMREPTIFWWPGKLKPGVRPEIATTLDLFPTFTKLAGAKMPSDRVYDGFDISPVIFGTGINPRSEVVYYRDTQVFAIRVGAYKAHFITQDEYGSNDRTIHNPPLLYNLNEDPSEKYNIARDHPEIIAQLKTALQKHQSTVVPVENQLDKR
ncbi:N-acetylgalactosamine-6-O-sulfatase [Dyadobacter sp. CECT 9275]|uniref:N-acetylgalactosamine-6-O-sulfatase n=1 Tax=Dyadobacter helix TaxID=2822344 RepID=A0A916JIL6_9BACT|nr:sulfatase [Dyadobacter sp. CECT 9275]CAG5018801.1 N-acetylgalactosamine-6-O-sulfatase [Dyadobacter sp. CECT 9275]